MKLQTLILIAYSGHAYVCIDVAKEAGYSILGYCDKEVKESNPYALEYLGHEMSDSARKIIRENAFFIGIGNNHIRYNITDDFAKTNNGKFPISLISPNAIVSSSSSISETGVLINPGVVVNSLAKIEDGAILNTSCVIEHECVIDSYAHIAPGAVLAGNVKVGQFSFIGANSVIKQGVSIGNDVTIGAGSVVLHDIPDGATAVGNPARIIKFKQKL